MAEATVIRRRDAVGHVWGDRETGEVADAWYASTHAVHMLVYTMAPRGSFGSTDEVRTVFDADQVYYVLEGRLALANPATGEVRVVDAGQAAHVGRGTWTHGVACGDAAVRVLELVSPGLESPAAVAYTASQPSLGAARYARGELHGRWPLARWDERRTATIRVLSEADLLWRLDGPERVLAGTWISTGRATVETVILRPGQRTELAPAPAATCAYVLDGRLGVRLPDGDRPWLELEPGDGLHLTAATVHRFGSFGSTPTRILRLVAT